MGTRQLSCVLAAALAACGGGSTPGPEVKQPATPPPDPTDEPEVTAKKAPPEDGDDGGGDDDDEEGGSYSHGKFTWFELFTTNPGKAAGFYRELFGWETAEVTMDGAKVYAIKNKGRELGLIVDAAKSPMPRQWLAYISVPEVDESVLDARANGGKVHTPPVEVKTVGVRFAVIEDPDGATFGVARRESGDTPDRQPTAGDFYWPQLMSTDPDDRYNFYSAVAGYTRNELTVGKVSYTRLVGDELCRGVITRVEKGFKPLWIPWVIVDAVDDAVARARKLGAKVAKPAWDAGEIGKVALLKDPVGNTFGVVAPLVAAPPPGPPDEDQDEDE